MTEYRIFGIGELLWDQMPEGRNPGGAPANFAYVTSRLGDRAGVLSRVGSDADGDELIEKVGSRGVDVSLVQRDPDRPTGIVFVSFSEGEPAYAIPEDAAWDALELTPEWKEAAAEADAVSFGTLSQRSPDSKTVIRGFLDHLPEHAVKLLDLNLRTGGHTTGLIKESLSMANALKINRDELNTVSLAFGIHGEDEIEIMEKLLERFDLEFACLTRGSEPSILATQDEVSEEPVEIISVADTVGAGDAFSAGLVHGILRDWPLAEINSFASTVGSYVAARSGAMPDFAEFEYPQHLDRS